MMIRNPLSKITASVGWKPYSIRLCIQNRSIATVDVEVKSSSKEKKQRTIYVAATRQHVGEKIMNINFTVSEKLMKNGLPNPIWLLNYYHLPCSQGKPLLVWHWSVDCKNNMEMWGLLNRVRAK
jgi:hypothetical protein